MAGNLFRFGEFELDCDRFELRRNERILKLERKPMELLILLATREGHLVTRSEIAAQLWNSEVFVDTEHGINTAVRKIRQVLRDDSERPRYVRTVTGKGYSFIGDLQPTASQTMVEDVVSTPAPLPTRVEGAEATFGERADAITGGTDLRPVRWLSTPVAFGVAIAGAALILAATIFLHRKESGNAPIRSLAVLPLENLSGDPGQDYLADGMTDELITMLAKNSTLRITSRTSVMQYKRVHRPLREIARELNVDGVLEGSVAASGNKVHLRIQLIDAHSDTHVWAESYDRAVSETGSLPGEAARTISRRLDRAVPQPAAVRYVSPEAHDAYLRGRYLWFLGKNDEAGIWLKKATELQPDYALGWSGLANYYGAGTEEGDLDPRNALPQSEFAARKAVELDDSLPEAHLSLGAALFFSRWDWEGGDRELGRAIQLNPAFAEAHHFRAKIYDFRDQHQNAIDAEKKAAELAPFERPWAVSQAYINARRYDEAIYDLRQKIDATPQNSILHWLLSEAYRRKGDETEAEQELEKMTMLEDRESTVIVHRAFAHGGYPAVVARYLGDLNKLSLTHYVSPVVMASLAAQLRHREQALALLEQGYQQHSPQVLTIKDDPAFDFLHSDERYRAIIRGIGFPSVQ